MIFRFSAFLLLGSLAGCVSGAISLPTDMTGAKWDVEAVSALPMIDDPYLAALQSGYLELARAERAEFDWEDAAEFAAKARSAAAGMPTGPFDLDARLMTVETRTELDAARQELLAFLASQGAMLRAPRQIGEAQVAWDCWAQEAEEAHQTADIDACRSAHEGLMVLARDLGALPANMAVVLPEKDGTIGGIELVEGGKAVTLDKAFAASGTGNKLGDLPVAEGEIREAFAGALAARPKTPVEFTVNFDFNSTRVDGPGYLEIARAVEEALSRPAAEILVTGFADAPGSSGANLLLSRARAGRVRTEVLRELGAQDTGGTNIEVTAFAKGEQGLIVSTTETARPNRRVLILVR